MPEKNFETGEVKEVAKTLDFTLSPQCSIKIFRRNAATAGRMIVSTMTFSPAGDMLNRCAFAEGRANVNSGELVVPDTIPDSGKDKAKDADADAETESVDAAPAAAPADKDEEEKEEKKEKKSEDSDI